MGSGQFNFLSVFLKHTTGYIEMFTYPQLIRDKIDIKDCPKFLVKVTLTFLLNSAMLKKS